MRRNHPTAYAAGSSPGPQDEATALVVTSSSLAPVAGSQLHSVAPALVLGVLPDAAVLLIDTRDIQGQVASVIRHLVARSFDGIVVLMTRFVHVPLWLGAQQDYSRPSEADRRARLVEWAVETLIPEYVARSARPFALPPFPSFVGVSPAVEGLRSMFMRVIEHDRATVLIRGASGTGKQVIARGVHDLSARAKRPFVEVNCTALPDTILESELFGREKGAYTDAHTSRQGLIETAGDGTLFLDEVGHITEKLQMALLKVIEQRTFRRVGGSEERTTPARFITATSRNLEEAISAGAFRSDLYYRLNVFTITLPELRERDADVLLLAFHYAREYAVDYGRPVSGITGEAALMLLGHNWPGNARELKNIIERAVVFHDNRWIDANALLLEGRPAEKPALEAKEDSPLVIDASGAFRISIPPWGLSLEAVERAVIEAALRATSYNITRAAKLLFISRDTLRYRMKKYGFTAEE